MPVDAALGAWRRLDLSADGVHAIRQGRSVLLSGELSGEELGLVRMYAEGLGFLGLGEIEAAGRLVPRRLISAGYDEA